MEILSEILQKRKKSQYICKRSNEARSCEHSGHTKTVGAKYYESM